MKGSTRARAPTLWDLASIVLEEVEKICGDEGRILDLAGEILIHIIQGHVKNMEIDGSVRRTLAGEGGRGSGHTRVSE